jgi:hypothetical protein
MSLVYIYFNFTTNFSAIPGFTLGDCDVGKFSAETGSDSKIVTAKTHT